MAITISARTPAIPGQVVVIVAVLAVCFAPMGYRITRGCFDVFEPVVGGTITLVVLFGIRPIYMMTSGDYTYEQMYNMQGQFTSTLVLGLIASLAFVVGYEIFVRRPAVGDRRSVPSAVNIRTIYRYGMVLVSLGTALFIVHLALGGSVSASFRAVAQGESAQTGDLFENSSEYLSAAPILVACAGILLSATIRRPTFGQRLAVLFTTFLPVILFYLAGTRRFIIPAIVITLLVVYMQGGRRPRTRNVVLVVPVVFLILATIPFARAQGAREQAGGADAIFRKSLSNPADISMKFIGSVDTAMLPALGVELDTLKRPADFYYGRATFGDLLLAPIPHVVIPGKPRTARNDLLTRTFGAPCSRAGCPDFSIIGTFYQDGWYIGVVCGMVLLGALAGRVWRRLIASPRDPRRIVLAATTAVFLPIVIRAGFMPAFTWFLMFLLPCALGLKMAKWKPGSLPGSSRGWVAH